MNLRFRRKSKYGAKRTTTDGYSFASKLESSVYGLIKIRENSGELRLLKNQQHLHFYYKDSKICEYWPDFTCLDLKTNEVFWVEAKGKNDNPDWRIKLNLWRAGGPGKLELWGGNYTRPFLFENVIPSYPKSLILENQVFAKLEF